MIVLPYDCIHEMGARVASAKKPFREQKLDKLTSVHELETLHSTQATRRRKADCCREIKTGCNNKQVETRRS